MIHNAPPDFWDRVIALVAKEIVGREMRPEAAAFGQKLPHLAQIGQPPLQQQQATGQLTQRPVLDPTQPAA